MSNQLSTINTQSAISCVNFYPNIGENQLDMLIRNYLTAKTKIHSLSEQVLSPDNMSISNYFAGSLHNNGNREYINFANIFDVKPAMNYLNASYWSMAIKEIKIEDFLPAKMRDEWSTLIQNHECPDFEEDTVFATLKSMLLDRDKFLAQKVEGIFNILSPEHVTNSPSGFGGKLIIYWDSNISYLNDLRGVVAKFMGRDDHNMGWKNTESIIDGIYKAGETGKWCDVDGGALSIKVYLKGTIHIKIADDISYKLNDILAFLHPNTIPSEFRKPRKAKKKEVKIINDLLSFEVISVLKSMENAYKFREHFGEYKIDGRKKNTAKLSHSNKSDQHVLEMVENVITLCGGVKTKEKGSSYYTFDYEFIGPVCDEICRLGYIPNTKSHQFYPTENYIAQQCANKMNFQHGDRCLEPSAGQGGLLEFMPDNTTAIEISNVQCEILKAKFEDDIINADFIKWSSTTDRKFDKIMMNPPYSVKRWKEHHEAALNLLDNGGKCVAVLPTSATNAPKLHGYEYSYSDAMSFDGVSIEVVIVEVNKL